MEKNTVMTSSFISWALLMAPEIYCISISSIAWVWVFRFNRSATLPACLDDNAEAMVLGVKFSSLIASFTLAFVSSLTLGYWLSTLETVEIATPAFCATSLMEAISSLLYISVFPAISGKRFPCCSNHTPSSLSCQEQLVKKRKNG